MELDQSGFSKKLVCIEYPGIVNDVNKMLDTLGGLKEVSTVCSGHNRRLELRFRPDDMFSKPACGDRCRTNGVLLKVKVLKKKFPNGSEENEAPIIRSLEIIGQSQTSFRFKSICDFQYLPMEVNGEGKMGSVCDSLLPMDFDKDNLKKWLEEPAEYFFPPAAFSRVDSISLNTYMYRKENKDDQNSAPGPLIGRTRRRRFGHAIFVSFNIANIPVKPREKALKFLEVKFLNGDQLETIRKLFNERPVWSKLALMCVTRFQHDQMKYLLPAVAYYFVTGPFRVMWVKFGYDPRKDPSARIYQTLDYRIRAPAGLLSMVKAKRSYANYLLPSKSSHAGAKSVVIMKDLFEQTDSISSADELREDAYTFHPNHIPAARQMFYQYCDIKAPEIEAMLSRLPKLPHWTNCDPRQGWLPPGFDNQCRDIINNYVIKLLKKEFNMEGSSVSFKEEEEVDDSSDEQQWEEEFDDEEIDNDSDTGGYT